MFEPTEPVISPPRAAPRRIKAGLAPSGPPVPDDPAARLRLVAQTVREMSRQTEPVSMTSRKARNCLKFMVISKYLKHSENHYIN